VVSRDYLKQVILMKEDQSKPEEIVEAIWRVGGGFSAVLSYMKVEKETKDRCRYKKGKNKKPRNADTEAL